ncbi:hypothetical protein K505DRAFT_360375 [Melanomma pulvis-pyrius CBS 109.77]|uniref:Uncharacterized protein n=1 Tax=Melanomma pulvis-pyrius CBS 109.77 TaxID=1314802 RepID=A0A6A6XG63_9PLEO|nr:hypothetical protein K505DRAFT_360375 [Melanomma pulvis-pyrius CBS 109.77]
MFLDTWVRYQDPTLPKFSSLTYLYFTILLSSFVIAFDLGKFFGQFRRRKNEDGSSSANEVREIAVIGHERLGTELVLLFAEDGIGISLLDDEEDRATGVMQRAEKKGCGSRVKKYKGILISSLLWNGTISRMRAREHMLIQPVLKIDYKSLCASLPKPRLLVVSLPHGPSGHKVLEAVLPHLARDDIILDCINEGQAKPDHGWRFKDTSVRYITCTVNDGHQSHVAQIGSNKSTTDDSIPGKIIELLERVATRDSQGRSHVGVVGKKSGQAHIEMVLKGQN